MSTAKSNNGIQRVLLAAGGTGGHMFPAQALARELIDRGVKVFLVTDSRGGGFGPELDAVGTHHIVAGGLAGGDLFARLLGLGKLAVGYLQARAILRRVKPQAVVGFGGYASVPTALAAQHLGQRVILHEQNQVVGRANRLLAGKASAIATSFETVDGLSEAARAKVVVTGNPVRALIAAVGRKPYGVPTEGGRLRLLITGGSQGARVFNELVPQAVSRLDESLRRHLQVVQQVRGDDHSEVEALYKACGVRAELASYFEDMPERLRAAHLMICRSGASTVAELAAAGRPAILVPFPFAADDHQTGNARAFAEAGAGWLMPQGSLTPDSLAERLAALLANPAMLTRAAHCARAFAHDDATARLADLVCDSLDSNGGRHGNHHGAHGNRPGAEAAE